MPNLNVFMPFLRNAFSAQTKSSSNRSAGDSPMPTFDRGEGEHVLYPRRAAGHCRRGGKLRCSTEVWQDAILNELSTRRKPRARGARVTRGDEVQGSFITRPRLPVRVLEVGPAKIAA